MWADNETERDFLNFSGVADTVAEIVVQARGRPISIGVRKHFEGVPDDLLVTNYFDKLIQVPIRVPALGTQEVRAYMMLLFVENSDLAEDVKEKIRAGVCRQLRQTWQGTAR